MVSWSGHVLPVFATVAMWFIATGLIAWLDNRARETFARSLIWAGCGAFVGLVLVVSSLGSATIWGVYTGFAGAILIWAWQEIGFLTGAVAGPRREACPRGAATWERFGHATAALAWHEIALAMTALLLVSLSWGAANPIAAIVFAMLYVMRLSSKLNIFAGVPNASSEILPPHLHYLFSYYGPSRFTPLLAVSIAAIAALAVWLGVLAAAAPMGSAEATGASLLCALAALGALEHGFFALPFRDGALWGWALPARRPDTTISRHHDITT